MLFTLCLLGSAQLALGGVLATRQAASSSSSSPVPDYFQTTPDLFPGKFAGESRSIHRLTLTGPTKTAQVAPFLAQTNPAPFGNEASFVPNQPLETAIPISGANNNSIFQLMGQVGYVRDAY